MESLIVWIDSVDVSYEMLIIERLVTVHIKTKVSIYQNKIKTKTQQNHNKTKHK